MVYVNTSARPFSVPRSAETCLLFVSVPARVGAGESFFSPSRTSSRLGVAVVPCNLELHRPHCRSRDGGRRRLRLRLECVQTSRVSKKEWHSAPSSVLRPSSAVQFSSRPSAEAESVPASEPSFFSCDVSNERDVVSGLAVRVHREPERQFCRRRLYRPRPAFFFFGVAHLNICRVARNLALPSPLAIERWTSPDRAVPWILDV
jgi:hypothetical protein